MYQNLSLTLTNYTMGDMEDVHGVGHKRSLFVMDSNLLSCTVIEVIDSQKQSWSAIDCHGLSLIVKDCNKRAS